MTKVDFFHVALKVYGLLAAEPDVVNHLTRGNWARLTILFHDTTGTTASNESQIHQKRHKSNELFCHTQGILAFEHHAGFT